ncbi:hypothetical protein E3N88_35276 [Mikania micrantha]|uniref:Nucleolus and neural progenitor protein-like N-terminal domain-containing protein n=1 Tax=Mikania micrantha TaxID=192012 RepID=A0A5N6M1F2_9ASTR|nr:hypothetical protein E3N88_35276 [Mikania micrantha]
MDAQVETIEARLRSFISQLQSELGVLERIIYKNKNQHRRSSYFQYLLKVRRDCKLLQSTNLLEIVNSSFFVIHGNRPRQKVHLLESLKRRKDGGKHSFLVRLQGAARLLSKVRLSFLQFHTEISTLLARSFFMGFCMTVLALLARLRVLTQQQMLLDVVSVFNMASSLSRKQQSIKLNHEGIEAFHFIYREYYPTNEQIVFLECVWKTDKFVLVEKTSEPKNTNPEMVTDDVICQGLSTVEYQSIETILGENKPTDVIVDKTCKEDPATMRTDNLSSMDGLTKYGKQVEEDAKDQSGVLESSIENLQQKQFTCSSLLANQDLCKFKPNKVAFISVKKPEASKVDDTFLTS